MAHDAGAARHLFSWLAPLEGQLRFCVAGPAANLLAKERPRSINLTNLNECLSNRQLLISGTGWASHLEHEARKLARQKKIPSIAIIDHWVNYCGRFEWNGERVLPDAIWVADTEALKIARHELPEVPIIKLSNQWIEDLKCEVIRLRKDKAKQNYSKPAKNLLYLIEPQRDPLTRKANGKEFLALEFWLHNLHVLSSLGYIDNCLTELNIKLRKHPSDPKDKYTEWIRKNQNEWNIRIDESPSLGTSLAPTDFVFGYETQALIGAIECGIPAMSCTPPDWPACRLPHKKLLHFRELHTKDRM